MLSNHPSKIVVISIGIWRIARYWWKIIISIKKKLSIFVIILCRRRLFSNFLHAKYTVNSVFSNNCALIIGEHRYNQQLRLFPNMFSIQIGPNQPASMKIPRLTKSSVHLMGGRPRLRLPVLGLNVHDVCSCNIVSCPLALEPHKGDRRLWKIY